MVPSEAENDESHQASGEEEQGAERYTDEPVRRSRHVDPIQTAVKNARVAKVQKIRLTRWRYGQFQRPIKIAFVILTKLRETANVA